MRGVQQICTFFVENQVFGVPVSQVQEVIRVFWLSVKWRSGVLR